MSEAPAPYLTAWELRAQKAKARAQRELDHARQRLADNPKAPVEVGNWAAAERLEVDIKTLGRWRDGDPPSGPPFAKQGSGKNSSHVRYRLSDLDKWLDDRYSTSRGELAQALKNQIQRNVRRANDRVLGFTTLTDVLDRGEMWLMNKAENLIGHFNTASDDQFDLALEEGDIITTSLEDALQMLWEDPAEREFFSQAFVAVLDHTATAEGTAQDKAVLGKEMEGKGADPPGSGRIM